MKKILIYERGTGVPVEKMAAADVVIEKIPVGSILGCDSVFGDEGCFFVHKHQNGEAGYYRPLSFLHHFLIDAVVGVSSYKIETLKHGEECSGFAIDAIEKEYKKHHSTTTYITSPRVQLENFIYDPSVIWYGPYLCPFCGALIIQSSRESGAIALDAPHGHHYPNHHWVEHECQ